MAAAGGLIEQAMPKVLLFGDVNDWDDRIKCVFHHIRDTLVKKHIVVTENFDDVATVQVTILFLDASLVRTHESYLKRFIEEEGRRDMFLTALFYENNKNVKLVGCTFHDFEGKYPPDFDFRTEDPAVKESMTEFILELLNAMRIDHCNIPFSNNMISIQDTLKPLIGQVITALNPCYIVYAQVPLKLLSEIVAMCDALDCQRKVQRKNRPTFIYREPLLVLLEFQPSDTQQKTSILQLIYSLNKIRNCNEFEYYLYVSMPPPDATGKLPSFWSVFDETAKKQAPYVSLATKLPVFIIIDDIHSFLEEGEDPKEMLADLVSKFGRGTVIMTTYTYPLNIKTDFGLGTHSLPKQYNLVWNAIFGSELEKLVLSESNMDVIRMEEETGLTSHYLAPLDKFVKEKNIHSIHFEEYGVAEKKFRQGSNHLVPMSSPRLL